MVKIHYKKTFQLQRELLNIPPGKERFDAYLQLMTEGTDDTVLPLGSFNPMAKEHVAELLDKLIELKIDQKVEHHLQKEIQRLEKINQEVTLSTIVIDDLKGGWTNRSAVETDMIFKKDGDVKRDMIAIPVWSSEKIGAQKILEQSSRILYRFLYRKIYGNAATLQEILIQEGLALEFANVQINTQISKQETEIIKKHLKEDHYPIIFSSLFGDQAAVKNGYDALGLSRNAGFYFAHQYIKEQSVNPEEVLHKPDLKRKLEEEL